MRLKTLKNGDGNSSLQRTLWLFFTHAKFNTMNNLMQKNRYNVTHSVGLNHCLLRSGTELNLTCKCALSEKKNLMSKALCTRV